MLKAVKQAERLLLETQDSKKYLGPEGDVGFVALLKPYIFGTSDRLAGRIAGLQTPGRHRSAAARRRTRPRRRRERRGPGRNADLAQSRSDLHRGGAADRNPPLRRSGGADRRLRRREAGTGPSESGRRRSAARLLPQPDRDRFLPGAVAGNRRHACGAKAGPLHRPRLPGPGKRARRGRVVDPPHPRSASRRRSSPIPATRTSGSIAIGSARSSSFPATAARRRR